MTMPKAPDPSLPTNAVCPVCSRPSVEDEDRDGTRYNHCVDVEGCHSVYVTPYGLRGPTMVLPAWVDADEEANRRP